MSCLRNIISLGDAKGLISLRNWKANFYVTFFVLIIKVIKFIKLPRPFAYPLTSDATIWAADSSPFCFELPPSCAAHSSAHRSGPCTIASGERSGLWDASAHRERSDPMRCETSPGANYHWSLTPASRIPASSAVRSKLSTSEMFRLVIESFETSMVFCRLRRRWCAECRSMKIQAVCLWGLSAAGELVDWNPDESSSHIRQISVHWNKMF